MVNQKIILIIGAAILVALIIEVGFHQQFQSESSLPRCNYTMTFQMQGEHHIGYWIGENAPGEKTCIIRFDEPGMIVDQGLP